MDTIKRETAKKEPNISSAITSFPKLIAGRGSPPITREITISNAIIKVTKSYRTKKFISTFSLFLFYKHLL